MFAVFSFSSVSDGKDNFRTISMAISKSQSAQKPRAADPEFRFAGNKKQYQLNKEVLEKTDEALATDDGEDLTKRLTEGKDLLVERKKHILLAEKVRLGYGRLLYRRPAC